MSKVIFIISLMFFIISCATTHVAMLDDGISFAPSEKVDILRKSPSKPFKEIAFLESEGTANIPETQCILNMKEKAKSIGADAIIIQSAETAVGGGGIFGVKYSKVRGIAIKFTD